MSSPTRPRPFGSGAAVLCAILIFPAAVTADALPSFGADDVFDLEFANDPQISPDGRRIVYERRSNDIMTDRTRSNLWVIDVDGGRHRPLTSDVAHATAPRWSPDGDRLAWFAATDRGTAIMLRWLDTGEEAPLATVRGAVDTLSWSPDGRWLAFQSEVRSKLTPLAKPRTGPEGSQWSEPVSVIDAVQYKRDGEGFVEAAYSHVFIVPSEGGTPRQLTSGDFNHFGPYAWSRDSQRLFFSANRAEDWAFEPVEADIYSVSIDDGALERITSRPGGEFDPLLSPDGSLLAFRYDDNRRVGYRNRVLTVMALGDDREWAVTADHDLSVANVRWAGNGRSLYFQYPKDGATHVARVTLDGELDVVATDLGGTTTGRPYLSGGFSVSPEGAVAYTRGTAERLADVAVVTGGRSRILTALNDDLLANRSLAAVHEIRYPSSHDGLEIQGWYLTPPDYVEGRAYPTILEIHGGPHLAYGPQFSAELQRYAAAGYVVFYDNHRGSIGYGEDFALKLQYLYSSEADFADHMSGLDALIERGIADPDRLFITGGSAGGIASAYAIGLTDRFVAAALQKPVINWVSKVLTADSYVYQIPYQFPGMPWEEHEHYWQRSPLSLVGNVTTPTMLITGEEDQRTPISETEQYYQALKLRRIDAVMVRVPGASHGIAGRPSRLNAKVDNVLAWFERYRTDDGTRVLSSGEGSEGDD